MINDEIKKAIGSGVSAVVVQYLVDNLDLPPSNSIHPYWRLFAISSGWALLREIVFHD